MGFERFINRAKDDATPATRRDTLPDSPQGVADVAAVAAGLPSNYESSAALLAWGKYRHWLVYLRPDRDPLDVTVWPPATEAEVWALYPEAEGLKPVDPPIPSMPGRSGPYAERLSAVLDQMWGTLPRHQREALTLALLLEEFEEDRSDIEAGIVSDRALMLAIKAAAAARSSSAT